MENLLYWMGKIGKVDILPAKTLFPLQANKRCFRCFGYLNTLPTESNPSKSFCLWASIYRGVFLVGIWWFYLNDIMQQQDQHNPLACGLLDQQRQTLLCTDSQHSAKARVAHSPSDPTTKAIREISRTWSKAVLPTWRMLLESLLLSWLHRSNDGFCSGALFSDLPAFQEERVPS